MSDEFFKKIGGMLDAEEQKKAVADGAAKDAAPLIADAIVQSAELAREYQTRLKELGISMSVESSVGGVSVEMRYQDGGYHKLSYHRSLDGLRLEAVENFISDNGKPYTSTDGVGDRMSTWSIDQFRARLEKVIESYTYYAPRHRGTT